MPEVAEVGKPDRSLAEGPAGHTQTEPGRSHVERAGIYQARDEHAAKDAGDAGTRDHRVPVQPGHRPDPAEQVR